MADIQQCVKVGSRTKRLTAHLCHVNLR